MSEAVLRVRVTPRASRNEVAGLRGDTLCVRVTAPPVEGAANAAVTRLVAGVLGVSRSRVAVTAGHRSRDKTLKIAGLSDAEVREKLGT